MEPGYYKEGQYGIRIENLVMSRRVGDGIKLVNITTVPYQKAMVDSSMLTAGEKAYYNECNKTCFEMLKRYLSYEAYEFLRENTQPIE